MLAKWCLSWKGEVYLKKSLRRARSQLRHRICKITYTFKSGVGFENEYAFEKNWKLRHVAVSPYTAPHGESGGINHQIAHFPYLNVYILEDYYFIYMHISFEILPKQTKKQYNVSGAIEPTIR